MKQGNASHSGMGSTKIEPRSQAVGIARVSQLGNHVGNHVSDGPRPNLPVQRDPLYEGRGLKAPMVGQTSHKAGSQGKR